MTIQMNSYFRTAIYEMDGYVPGEQPKERQYIKLNTNENPYPPSANVVSALSALDPADFRRYSDPVSDDLRDAAAEAFGVTRNDIIAGNGSDDILTIAIRSFVEQGGAIATVDPTYSLYPVLAQIQGATTIAVPLAEDFSLPDQLLDTIQGADMLFIARPNAPTGNIYPLADMERICEIFEGIVFIDEAYADFSQNNCLHFASRFDNAIVSRTLSKSYSLAGLRVGFGIAHPEIISGMMKVKDSYNLSRISQALGAAALRDPDYLRETLCRVIATRNRVTRGLEALGFQVVPSETNFVFAKPPVATPANELFTKLRDGGILVRYFGGSPKTREYIRVTIGTDDEMTRFLETTRRLVTP